MTTKSPVSRTATLAVCLLLTAAVFESAFTPTGVQKGYLSVSEEGQPSAQAVSHALGEFRIVASNMIWLNVVDRYHHEYLENGGKWSRNESLLPFLSMITWLDPHFVQAYDVEGSILADLNKYDAAQQTYAEGIKNNPNSWQLPYDVAMLDAWYRKDAKSALPAAKVAYGLATDPLDRRRIGLFVSTLSTDVAENQPVVRS